ncbi:MAG TPA: hypothetical protein VLU92_05285 [Candidatus Dormibacteraeota bacterium]|nr:hypothetical protein [Candidatus Dormibacteraeota bacterium]
MPITHSRPPAWLWGVYFGLFIGGGVVLAGTFRYGFQPELLLVGAVLVLVFAIIGLFSGFVGRYTPGGPT